MRRNHTNSAAGFGILELLVVIAIIGILAAIAFPTFFSARNRAQDRAAETYAGSVYKVAFAFISENLATGVVTDPDCSDGYLAGGYDVDPPGGVVTTCTVTVAGDGSPIITVESANGKITVLSN